VSGVSVNPGAGRYYYCVISALNASSENSTPNRGYLGAGSLTYQWQRSAGDADSDYADIVGGTTNPYNDTGAPLDGSGRYYKVVLNAEGASQAITDSVYGFTVPSNLHFDTLPATNILHTSAGGVATLNSDISNLGSSENITVYFQWGYALDYLPNNTPATSVNTTGAFSYTLSGFQDREILYYRLEVIDNDGLTAGDIEHVASSVWYVNTLSMASIPLVAIIMSISIIGSFARNLKRK